jgi:zinc transporter ZupT
VDHGLIWSGLLASFVAGAMTGVGALPAIRVSPRFQDVMLGFAAGGPSRSRC